MSGEWRTDKGKVRSLNEDAVYFNDRLGSLTLAIVADGMGGHQGGDVASKLAIDIILQELKPLTVSAVAPSITVSSSTTSTTSSVTASDCMGTLGKDAVAESGASSGRDAREEKGAGEGAPGALGRPGSWQDGAGVKGAPDEAVGQSLSFETSLTVPVTAITVEQAREAMRAAIMRANQEIYWRAMNDERLRGMGTTVVGVLLSAEWGCIAHVGDSRAYALRKGQLIPLTHDHSLVNELVKSGQISEAEAVHHPQRNVLMRAVGTNPEVEVELSTYNPQPGDWLLLCSDGLTSMLSDTQISQILSGPATLQEKADRLLQMALNEGGEDNISFIFCSPPQGSKKRQIG